MIAEDEPSENALPSDGETVRRRPADRDPAYRAASRGLSRLGRKFVDCRDVFVALGDENRQLIFLALLDHYGGMRVGELVDVVGLSRPAVSHHLRILKDAGLVDRYPVGAKNFYHVKGDSGRWTQLAGLANSADSFVHAWNEARKQGMEPPYRKE